jgi:hypothetical protein
MADRILTDDDLLADGTVIVARAFRAEDNPEFPSGVKYRFQAHDPATGRTVLRYDNAPTHPDVGRHHKHLPDGRIVPLAVDTSQSAVEWVTALYRVFRRELRHRS